MSEALQLADELEQRNQHMAVCAELDAAAELRRLHDLVEDGRILLRRKRDEIAGLKALNAELVEALRCADAMLSGANMDAKAVERKVSAALAKVEKSK